MNFIDTAEMYPVPNFDPKWCPGHRPTWDQLEISARHSESLDLACAGAQLVSGTTEEYIGSWLDKNPELRSKAPTETI